MELQDLRGVSQVPNGQAATEPGIRVRFGQLPNQTMPIEWAEEFIRIVYAERPDVFRAILPRLYGLPEPEPKRSRKPQP